MAAGYAAEVDIAVVYLAPELLALQGVEAVVVLGVIGHFVAVGDHALYEVRPLAHAAAHDEEGDFNALLLEDIQKLPTRGVMRAIVDGDRDLFEVAVAVFE